MAKVFITLTGTRYYHGNEFLRPGMKVKLTKEPDNKYGEGCVGDSAWDNLQSIKEKLDQFPDSARNDYR